MQKATLTLMAAASLILPALSARAADNTSSLAGAEREQVEAAADEDAVAWHNAHLNSRHNEGVLQNIGRAHGLQRGLRADLLLAYYVTFDKSVTALEQPN